MGKSFIEKAWDLFELYDPLQLQYKEVLAEANERILDCEDKLGYNEEEFITGLELLEELVEKLRVIAPKADQAWVNYMTWLWQGDAYIPACVRSIIVENSASDINIKEF